MKNLFIIMATFGFTSILTLSGFTEDIKPSKEFKHLVFEDDFKKIPDGEEPTGWKIWKSNLHDQREIKDEAYRILTRGNTHSPVPVSLKDFAMEFDVHGHRNAPVTILNIDYRIKPDATHQYAGYRILYRWGAKDHFRKKFAKNKVLQKYFKYIPKTVRFDLLDLRYRENREPILNKHFIEIGSPGDFDPKIAGADQSKMKDFEKVGETAHIRIEVKGNKVRLFHNGHFQGEIVDTKNTYPDAGMIGFDMEGSYPTFPGALTIDNVKIFAKKPLKKELIGKIDNIEIPFKFNRIHGGKMFYNVAVYRYGRGYILAGSARGGGCSPWPPHLMLNPYVRLETVDGKHRTNLYLYRGTVGNQNISLYCVAPAPFDPADHGGPVSNQCYFDYDPDKYRIAVGYEFYGINPYWQNGPCEVIVDPVTKKVLHEGIPMKNGVVLTMSSPPEKATLNRIRKDNKFYQGFKDFLKDNHYFVEGEPIRFKGDLLMCRPDPKAKYICRFKVLDAFKDKILQENNHPFTIDTSELAKLQQSCGITHFTTGWINFTNLKPGVYHLEMTALDPNGLPLDIRLKAFSVLPEKVDLTKTPAERSGLPRFFDGCRYPFQEGYQIDAYHYSSEAGEWLNRADAIEVQHALNKRVSVQHVDLTKPEQVKQVKKYGNKVYALAHPNLPEELKRIGSPRIYSKGGRNVKYYVGEFLDSSSYKPKPGCEIKIKGKEVAKLNNQQYTELYNKIKKNHWKEFTGYICQLKKKLTKKVREYVKDKFPGFKIYSYGYPLPCNLDYMTPYGMINSAGIDLKNNGWPRDIVCVEGYFDECRYASDREWACWAIMKMVRPECLYFRDAEGYSSCMSDGNNAYGWPPFGTMNVNPGFFKKVALMNVYNPMYFKNGKVHWAWDNAYRLGAFPPDRVAELIEAFNTAHKIKPEKPVPTLAYIFAQEWFKKHPEFFDYQLYPYNTSEESIVFAYEEGNRAGVLNGFFVDLSDLQNLDTSIVNTLVLPPLDHADPKIISKIRDLFNQGVNLVCFESVPGLEDLFGIKPVAPSKPVTTVQIADNNLAENVFYDINQTQVFLRGNIKELGCKLTTGTALLNGIDQEGKIVGPVLVLNKGQKANTLLWTIPPTDISRTFCHVGSRMRGECDSELIRHAMGRGLKLVADTPVTATAGNLISFWDKKNNLIVIVYENNFPFKPQPIHPKIQIKLKDIGKSKIKTDTSYRLGTRTDNEMVISCSLKPDEIAIFIFEKL